MVSGGCLMVLRKRGKMGKGLTNQEKMRDNKQCIIVDNWVCLKMVDAPRENAKFVEKLVAIWWGFRRHKGHRCNESGPTTCRLQTEGHISNFSYPLDPSGNFLVCGWEPLGSSLAPHLIGNMNTHSSLAPLDFRLFGFVPSVVGHARDQLIRIPCTHSAQFITN